MCNYEQWFLFHVWVTQLILFPVMLKRRPCRLQTADRADCADCADCAD